MGIDHRPATDERSDIHVHGRHAYHTGGEVGAATNSRTARDDANGVLNGEGPRRIRVLVEKAESWLTVARRDRHVLELTDAKPEQDAALDPRHRAPGAVCLARRRSHLAGLQLIEQLVENFIGADAERRDVLFGAELLDALLEGHARAPALRSAARTVSRCASASGTRGDRSRFSALPSSAMAALTGTGLDSTNAARIQGSS